LFDCITCDKCVPVCPNDANFAFDFPKTDIPVVKLRYQGAGWVATAGGRIAVRAKHQIGNFADFCNDCGNCDVFCPEDGGPYVIKPRFFGSLESWRRPPTDDGFFIERREGREIVYGRFSGAEYRMEIAAGCVYYEGDRFAVRFTEENPAGTIEGHADGEVDLTYFEIMNLLRATLLASSDVNYINCLSLS
jgi:putative selenate reductase